MAREKKPKPKKKLGRPTDYCTEVADAICERIADGESLRSICRDETMPAKSAVFKWLGLHPAFADQYARARETQADAIFDEILDIADDAQNDWMKRNSEGNEGWQANGEHIQRSKLRIDARKWMAGKMRPKKYGELIKLDHGSSDGSMTPPKIIEFLPAPMPDENE